MSMGMFLFLGDHDKHVLVHEYGHSIQSCILGPLYLPVIGIPSLIWASDHHFVRIPAQTRLRVRMDALPVYLG